MEFLVPIVAFIGVFLGKLIGWLSSDEIKSGLPYFFAAKKFILFGIFALLTTGYAINLKIGLLLFSGLVIGKIFDLAYLWLGFAMVLSLGSWMLLPVASLTFLYGLIYGSLEKSYFKESLFYFAPFFILLLNLPHEMLSALISGTLLALVLFSE